MSFLIKVNSRVPLLYLRKPFSYLFTFFTFRAWLPSPSTNALWTQTTFNFKRLNPSIGLLSLVSKAQLANAPLSTPQTICENLHSPSSHILELWGTSQPSCSVVDPSNWDDPPPGFLHTERYTNHWFSTSVSHLFLPGFPSRARVYKSIDRI